MKEFENEYHAYAAARKLKAPKQGYVVPLSSVLSTLFSSLFAFSIFSPFHYTAQIEEGTKES
jgi:hypothetical protein